MPCYQDLSQRKDGAEMTENSTVTQLKDTTANPAPLGLMGFGMTTVLLNLHNAGILNLDQ